MKDYNNEELTFIEKVENCVFPQVFNGIMSSKDSCILEATCDSGTLVNVQVNDAENHNFYVISDIDDKLTLILDKNLVENVAWENSASTGPINALNVSKDKTIDWANISETEYIIKDDSGKNRYKDIKIKSRVRMIYYTEALKLECKDKCPNYLCENLENCY